MKLNIEEMKREPLKKERLAYNGETGNRIDVEVYLSPLRAMYKVGKEGEETAKLFDNLKSAIDQFNYLEGMELDVKILEEDDCKYNLVGTEINGMKIKVCTLTRKEVIQNS